jgi:cysteine desulfurase
MAILGTAYSKKHNKQRGHILTTKIEHKAVLEPCNYLIGLGWEIDFLPVDNFGIVDINSVEKFVRRDTLLISVQLANSEIGTLQPIKQLAMIAH